MAGGDGAGPIMGLDGLLGAGLPCGSQPRQRPSQHQASSPSAFLTLRCKQALTLLQPPGPV